MEYKSDWIMPMRGRLNKPMRDLNSGICTLREAVDEAKNEESGSEF